MSIDILCKSIEIDYNELQEYESDPLVICFKDFLPKVTGPLYEKAIEADDEKKHKAPIFDFKEWYPFCNSYYHHSEQVDYFARTNHLIGLNSDFSRLNSESNITKKTERKFFYSTRQSQIDYLRSKPLSFWITGKPSIGEENLGKQLADHWQCVYIDPESLIREEIESRTRAGSCIEFNLRCGRAIGVDIILRLVEKRVKSESVLHRGFVLCGLPLIPNDLYEEDPVSAESALFTVQEIFEDILDSIYENEGHPVQTLLYSTSKMEEDTVTGSSKVEFEETISNAISDSEERSEHAFAVDVIPPDLGDAKVDVCYPPDVGPNYEQQLSIIKNLFDEPYMIIYMVSENQDAINKRRHYRYDIYSKTVLDLMQEKTEMKLLKLLPNKNQIDFSGIHQIDDIFENVPSSNKESSELIHLVKLPRDFPANVQTQLQRYHYVAVELIEAEILLHDPEFYLKVDARTSIARMLNSVKWKLRTLNIQRVIVPEKLNSVESMDGEDGYLDVAQKSHFENMEECFRAFCRKRIVNPMFKWEYSDWGSRCPVAMAEGNYLEGDPKYSVQFMNSIFFLSNQQAFIKFHRNPRPFLLPPNPRSHGKLYVIGPGCSGKTAVSTCLGYLLNSTVLSPDELYKNFVNQRRENLIDRKRQAMITDKLAMVNEELRRQHLLEDLKLSEKVNIWLAKFRTYIEGEYQKVFKSRTKRKLKSFPMPMGFKSSGGDVEVPFEAIFLNEITILDLLENPDRMRMYLPLELRESVKEFVPLTVLDESMLMDIETQLRNSDIDEIILGEEDLLDMYGTAIRQEEVKYMQSENCRGGWIIDGFPHDINFFQRVCEECPPDRVVLLEDSSSGQFLVDRFKSRGGNSFSDYHRLFHIMGRSDITNRIETLEPIKERDTIVKDTLDDLLTRKEFFMQPDDKEDITEENLLERRKSQIEYRKELIEFQTTKQQFLDLLKIMKKDVIVIDVRDKSLENLMKHVISTFEDKYRFPAEVFSDIDRLQEARDFGHNYEAEGADEDANLKGKDEFEMNRRYGDTYNYCPVTFHDKGVLWKGKKEYAAKFQGKLYFCSSKEDLNSFIENPRTYLPIDKPFSFLPPPRICVVGNARSGKTAISKVISKNFASCYFDFMEFLRRKGSDDEQSENYLPIQEYLLTDTPLPLELLREFLYPLWFEEPYITMGFVIDDFPKRPSDITAIVLEKIIPDIVIGLKVPKNELYQRTIEKELADIQVSQLKRHEEHLEVLQQWKNTRTERFNQLMDAKRQQRYMEKTQHDKENKLEETDDDGSTFKSQITFDSFAEQEDKKEVKRALNEELPEPVFGVDIENMEERTERIRGEFDYKYSRETESLRIIRELLLAASIPWEDLKSDKKIEVTQHAALLAVDAYKFRNRSFFERTYETSMEVAERLLSKGYYFLSMFGRTCPVQYHKNDVKLQLFIPMELRFNVFPIIHRQYIYFLAGKVSKENFRKDPLKYVDIEKFNFPLLPIRIAVIGPPKCGKTALADRFRVELGLKMISKGQAARYVMNYLPYSDLAVSMESILRKGLVLKEKMVLSCVEAASFDPRAVTQGIVMDGFPNSAKEVKYLTSMGLMPQLIIDLFTEDLMVYDYVSNEASKMFDQPYSKHFMHHRYNIWKSDQVDYRAWLEGEFQNIVRIPMDTCIWDIWEKAYEFMKAAAYEIRHYFIYSKEGWPLRLANMLVSPLEFLERQSSYKTYCPCCLYYFNRLISGGFPPDRTGLVHFRKYFYYICPDHIEEFLDTPCEFLPPYNTHKLPVDLPEKLKLSDMPPNAYQGGYCTVCCKEKMRSVKGLLNFALKFGRYVYLCDSLECQKKLNMSPMTYFDVKISMKDDINYPPLGYKDLPPLGALEQFVAKDVIEAIKATATIRPVLPGLTVQQSALLTMAINLKLNNKQLHKKELEIQKKALALMQGRRKSLLDFLDMFKRYRNPFIYYEEPVPALKITDWIKEKFGNTVPSWSYTEIRPDKGFKALEERNFEDFDE